MAEEVATHCDYLPIIFRRCVAAVLGSYIHSEKDAFERVVMLAEAHMEGLFSELAKVCHVQRRQQPSLEDLSVLLGGRKINIFSLEAQKMLRSHLVDELNQLQFALELEPLAPEAIPFYDAAQNDMNLKAIVPSVRRMPPQVPKWMPPLPPDHTYMSTPQYTNRVRDLRQTREELVEEGRLAELALQRLLGQSGTASAIELVPEEKQDVTMEGNQEVEDQRADRSNYITVVDHNTETDGTMQNSPQHGRPDYRQELESLRGSLEPDQDQYGVEDLIPNGLAERTTVAAEEPLRDTALPPEHAVNGRPAPEDEVVPDEGIQESNETHEEPPKEHDTTPKVGIKLKLNTSKKEVDQEPPRDTPKKGLSLKLHLGASKRPMKVENPFKRRPRVDIVGLAHKLSAEGKLSIENQEHTESDRGMNGNVEQVPEKDEKTERNGDPFQALGDGREPQADLGELFEEALTSVS